mmetsp:Transcript_39030/g.125454  ORF Transcript_39030/g.125454 Transcript_39030/m.125454 type:complete len:211 (+) Transcript_39030:1344-1976(+)
MCSRNVAEQWSPPLYVIIGEQLQCPLVLSQSLPIGALFVLQGSGFLGLRRCVPAVRAGGGRGGCRRGLLRGAGGGGGRSCGGAVCGGLRRGRLLRGDRRQACGLIAQQLLHVLPEALLLGEPQRRLRLRDEFQLQLRARLLEERLLRQTSRPPQRLGSVRPGAGPIVQRRVAHRAVREVHTQRSGACLRDGIAVVLDGLRIALGLEGRVA